MTIDVIGAGFGRTGTNSLKHALEQLGFGPCCHGFDERHFGQDTSFWHRVFNREQIEWDDYFGGYRSTVDSPSCRFYLELSEKYPSAKIILTLRDSNAWYESYKDTILPLSASIHGDQYFTFLFGSSTPDRESMIAAYERHNTEVQRFIPSERLLVYQVEQGWQPLCDFLHVPVPNAPFPHANLRVDFPTAIDALLLARLKQQPG